MDSVFFVTGGSEIIVLDVSFLVMTGGIVLITGGLVFTTGFVTVFSLSFLGGFSFLTSGGRLSIKGLGFNLFFRKGSI